MFKELRQASVAKEGEVYEDMKGGRPSWNPGGLVGGVDSVLDRSGNRLIKSESRNTL